MNEEGWMFSGGRPEDFTVRIGKVSILKRTTKRVYLDRTMNNDSQWCAGFRECVASDEVYANEEDCREAAAKRVAETKLFFEEKIARMTRAVLGQPEEKK